MYGGGSSYNTNTSHHQHHHYPGHHHKGVHPQAVGTVSPESAHAAEIFEHFIAASTFKSVLHHYQLMCNVLRLRPTNIRHFYPKLKSKIRSWKAQALWSKYDKRASHKCYNHGKAASQTKVLIIGCGPCGLRAAIEAQLLGAKVVVVEKRDRFSRNNVLHLWPFVIADLKALGAKKFYGKFCAGAIDHISIRQLQCILLKVALLLGVEVFEGVTFDDLLEPPEDQSQKIGWHAKFTPSEHPVNQYEFDVLIGADGKRNTLMGFKRKEFRGKLAIAITANFINKHSEEEARVQEISGVAFIFNQKFFKDLYAATGIDLENIVYYKDETHYFVMTAKKHSLIDKGVILRDLPDTQQLLHPNNVDRKALCDYAREAADFSTAYQMPHLDFAVNHYGKPDIAMFDFTSMFAAENACRVNEKRGHRLLQCLVGDSLLEPFWPTGSGCARGFLSSLDSGWAIRSWASNKMDSLEVIAERESIYRLLAQTTPENLGKDYSSYTLEPSSRYPTVNLKVLLPFQVRHLRVSDEPDTFVDHMVQGELVKSPSEGDIPRKRKRKDSIIQPETLLTWCQKQVAQHEEIKVEDLNSSFKDGRVFCAIIHRYRPDIMDFESLKPENESENNQLALDILEKEFGIQAGFSGVELSSNLGLVDQSSLISFISQIHDAFRGEIPQSMGSKPILSSFRYKNIENVDLEDFPALPTDPLQSGRSYINRTISLESARLRGSDGRISCKVSEQPKLDIVSLENQKIKKRRNEVGYLDANAYERQRDIAQNRQERLRKQKEQRELNTIRFIRSMRMLHCDVEDNSESHNNSALQKSITPSYREFEDMGLIEYRKLCAKSMKEKAVELERKLYYPDKMDVGKNVDRMLKPASDPSDDFSDKVKGLEDKFKGSKVSMIHQKPKDLIRSIGRLEKTDWNLSAIEKKIEDNPKPIVNKDDREKVPKWSKDLYNDKFQNIERRLRENGEDEERIAKYLDIDASLKRLERKLREGSTLETGLRGHNKVSNLANQLSSKLVRKDEDKTAVIPQKQVRPMVLPSSSSDMCYFCGTRVYLVERLSAEGKFFHRQCFKCSYCGVLLRLGNYIYDRENRFGGKFFCIPHFGLSVRPRKRIEEDALKGSDGSSRTQTDYHFGTNDTRGVSGPGSEKMTPPRGTGKEDSGLTLQLPKGAPTALSVLEDRGTTPERVEFENSIIEHSDEEEYLSEDEWTDRNFGASANELDDDDDDDSDYSDLSDEEIDDDALESGHQLTAAETRRLAESWKRRYSKDLLEGSKESLLDSEEDDLSEENGVEGDDSHTATEGEMGDDDDEDDEGAKRARELRKLELNINVEAPPMKVDTSDSGSETEVASDDESDTHIDTDSEFGEDNTLPQTPKEIPTIIINEMPCEKSVSTERLKEDNVATQKVIKNHINEITQEGSRKECFSQPIDSTVEKSDEQIVTTSLINNQPNPRTEQLKRLLQRTESHGAVSAYKLNLRKEYLLGNTSDSPKKSVSTADLGDRFKSFMDKISETQKKLQPAPEPSPAMQAFLHSSTKVSAPSSSRSYKPILPQLRLSSLSSSLFNGNNEEEHNSPATSSDTSKSEEGNVFSFTKKDKNSSDIKLDKNGDKFANEDTAYVLCTDEKGAKLTLELANDSSSNNQAISSTNTVNSDHLNNEEKTVETVNLELLSNNVLNYEECDKVILENPESSINEMDIDECFDKLAKDAISEINQLESSSNTQTLVASFSDLNSETYAKPSDTFSCNADNSNLKTLEDNFTTDTMDENIFTHTLDNHSGDQRQEESGFKSLEENKIDETKDEVLKIPELTLINGKDNEEIVSPVTYDGGLTECDLSDWADDNDINSIVGEHMDEEIGIVRALGANVGLSSFKDSQYKARIASLESLGDSDSAISVSIRPNKDKEKYVTKEFENFDYMDISSEGENSQENKVKPFSYMKLKNEIPTVTPTAPLLLSQRVSCSSTPVCPNSDDVKQDQLLLSQRVSCSSTPVCPNSDDVKQDQLLLSQRVSCSSTPVCPNSHSDDVKQDQIEKLKSKSLDVEESFKDSIPRSSSEPRAMNENTDELINNSSTTPKRYEGYIPRFKDRMTPFSYVRDSIDVRKCPSAKPLFTPSKEDIMEREKNEQRHYATSSLSSSSSSLSSPSVTAVGSRVQRPHKPKDGDVVKEMVMSRISKKSGDRIGRRGSKNSPLFSFNNSSSPYKPFTSDPSLNGSGSLTTPTSEDINKSSKESEFSSSSESSSNKNIAEIIENLDVNIVPSETSCSKYDKIKINDEITRSQAIHNDEEEVFSRSILPATPLTHPEIFEKENQLRREQYKSTPHLPSSNAPLLSPTVPPLPPRSPFISSKNLNNLPLTINRDTVVKTHARAQSESPLSRTKHIDTSSSGREPSNERPHSVASRSSGREPSNERPHSVASRDRPESSCERAKKDPEERLKELLAERRRKETEEHREVRLRNKDTCLKECLEEYRQKRNSAPIPLGFSVAKPIVQSSDDSSIQTNSDLSLKKRHFHRPSLLELESLQVFSSPSKTLINSESPHRTSMISGSPNRASPLSESHRMSQSICALPISNTEYISPPNRSPVKISLSPSILNKSPLGSSSINPTSAPSENPVDVAKKPVKKSKDRERRRSLIQVFAGMFTKSDDRKKSLEENTSLHDSSLSVSPSSTNSSSTAIAPKSPSVRERFSKLRLSRSKNKKKVKPDDQDRSTSVDMTNSTRDEAKASNSLSLPNTPSRSMLSFLSSPSIRGERIRQSASEEALSEDEGNLLTASATTCRESMRKQKAVQRAAKQAEQKRLRMAQEIQRQMEECEVMARDLEERGIKIEKALTGEMDKMSREESELMCEWFRLVREKNDLMRWQEELTIKAKELQLEDRHVRLENELRQRMTSAEKEKTREDIDREGDILAEIISVIEQKDALASLLEEDRQRYVEEDKELEEVEARKILHRNKFERETGV